MISLDSLKTLKGFAADPNDREILLRDKMLIDGLIYLLSHEEKSIVKLTLEIFLLLAECSNGQEMIKTNEYLLLQMKETTRTENQDILDLSEKFCHLFLKEPSKLCESDYQTPKQQRSCHRSVHQTSNSRQQKHKTYVFQLKGLLDKHDRELCTRLLIKIKGVVSIIYDMNRSRCTVRTLPKVLPETLAEAIAKSQTMLAQQVVKNEFGEETILSFGNENPDKSLDVSGYLDDVDSPPVEKQAVCLKEGLDKSSSSFGNWFQKATQLWTNGFW